MKHWLCLVPLLVACGPDRFEQPEPEPEPAVFVDLRTAPGDASCGDPLMVRIALGNGTFCIDRFEAFVDGSILGNPSQGSDDTDTSVDGSTQTVAGVEVQVTPRATVTWYQASSSCQNAGKRLCTVGEWERACRGSELSVYPYGDEVDDDACNGFFNGNGAGALLTGSLPSCGNDFGAYDMSGNLTEWTATAVERTPGSGVLNDRAVRGGSFRANFSALRCLGEEFHEAPATANDEIGFRCCSDN